MLEDKIKGLYGCMYDMILMIDSRELRGERDWRKTEGKRVKWGTEMERKGKGQICVARIVRSSNRGVLSRLCLGRGYSALRMHNLGPNGFLRVLDPSDTRKMSPNS